MVIIQIQVHNTSCNLYKLDHYAFWSVCSTKADLVAVVDNVFLFADTRNLSILLLIDLSFAFDTVSNSCYMPCSSWLHWDLNSLFTSYLRFFQVLGNISLYLTNTNPPQFHLLKMFLRQGIDISTLKPTWFLLPILFSIAACFHCYDNDMQIYFFINLNFFFHYIYGVAFNTCITICKLFNSSFTEYNLNFLTKSILPLQQLHGL